ncbi:MAG: YfhO family protein [Lachnospiraceae bacterium]|nr:YfhO family protein [Lachnospiraceae bacterium]MCM1240687.1 YfhO family protein [Lachnospiraceae bacterium]
MIKTGFRNKKYRKKSSRLNKIFEKGYTAGQIQALAFLLPFIIMLTLFVIKGIYPFGGRSFLSGDLYHQYMPFFSELLRKVRAGESLNFSYHVGIGSNFLALYVYYLASPLHALALLVPEKYLIEFISYLVVCKIGFAGWSSCYYLQKHFVSKSPAAALFASFYALSGFMAAYNYNIMWLDCVILLPLIVLGLERLVKEGKCGLYCVTLGLCIFTNYYISIMICIFLVLYFVILVVMERCRHLGRSIGCFALFSLLAGGMAAALLIPEVCAILQTDFGDMDFPKKTESYFSVLDMLVRHCMCVDSERGLDHWPNIYCGSAALMLLPMYALDQKISIRERFCKLALMGFLLLSFGTNILDFMWHGMNYPDSLPARQSFLYIFLVLTACYDVFHHIRETDEQQILHGYLAAVVFFLFCQKFVDHEDLALGVKLLTLVFVSIYAVLLYLYRTRSNGRMMSLLLVVALAAVTAENSINTFNTSLGTVSRSDYLGQQEDYKALYEWAMEQEEGFWRVEKFSRKTKNDATLAGYPSASVFSSTMNSQVMDLYKRLGMRHSKVFYGYDGATAFTAALLNVHYMFGDSDRYENSLYELVGQSGEVFLYRAARTLPFGYVAPVGYDLPDGYANKGLALQDQMVRMLGIQGKLFEEVDSSKKEDDVIFTAPQSGIYYAIVTASGTSRVTAVGVATDTEDYSDLKMGSVLYLGYLDQGRKVTLTNGNEDDETPAVDLAVYRMDEEVLGEALDLLSKQHLEQVEYTSDRIYGEITMEEAGRLILSVPLEAGWRIRVNGEEGSAVPFGGCLVAFDLEPGEYTIEMHYVPQGQGAGIAVTVVSVLAFGAVMIWRRRRNKGFTPWI